MIFAILSMQVNPREYKCGALHIACYYKLPKVIFNRRTQKKAGPPPALFCLGLSIFTCQLFHNGIKQVNIHIITRMKLDKSDIILHS